VAVFIYRKPFQHLFSSVGYGMLGRDERAEVSLRESAWGFRRVTATATGAVVPGVAASRWARRNGASATGADGAQAAADAAAADAAPPVPTADSHVAQRQWPEAGSGTARPAPPLPLPQNGTPPSANGASAGWARGSAAGTAAGTGGARRAAQPPVRSPGSAGGRSGGPSAARSGQSESGNGKAPAPPFWARSRRRGQ